MIKIAVNGCYGGFGLSKEALKYLSELKNREVTNMDIKTDLEIDEDAILRHDPDLIRVIEEIGIDEAAGEFASIQLVATESTKYRVSEYDGLEWIETPETIDWIEV